MPPKAGAGAGAGGHPPPPINNCLICNAVLVKNIKIEIGTTTTEELSSADLQGGGIPTLATDNNNAQLLCELLKLSASSSDLVQKDLPPSSPYSSFCSQCSIVISNVSSLFDQIRNLQGQVDQYKRSVESDLRQCYLDHINGFDAAGASSSRRRRQASRSYRHQCRSARSGAAGQNCSIVEKLRELILSDLDQLKNSDQELNTGPGNDDITRESVTLEKGSASDSAENRNHRPSTSPSRSSLEPGKNSRLRKPRVNYAQLIKGEIQQMANANDNTQLQPPIVESKTRRRSTVPIRSSPEPNRHGSTLTDDPLYEPESPSASSDENNSDENESSNEVPKQALFGLKECKVSLEHTSLAKAVSKSKKPGKKRKLKTSPNSSSNSTETPKPKRPRPVNAPTTTPLKCPECPQTFKSEFKLNFHAVSDHNAKPLSSCTCGKLFYTEFHREKHLAIQGGQCQKRVMPNSIIEISGQGNLRYECNICQKTFAIRNRALDHSIVHSKEKTHQCNLCPEIFSFRNALKTHQMVKHFEGPLDAHPYKCLHDGCNKIFGNPTRLRIHGKYHRNEYDFHCETCDFKAISAGLLNAHVRRTHLGIRNYKCQFCEKSYTRNDRLTRHMLGSHTEEADRPYRCCYCDKSFSEKYRLNRHEIIHTTNKPKLCTICGKTFAVQDYLRIHMLSHNNRRRKQRRPAAAAAVPRMPRMSRSKRPRKQTKSELTQQQLSTALLGQVEVEEDVEQKVETEVEVVIEEADDVKIPILTSGTEESTTFSVLSGNEMILHELIILPESSSQQQQQQQQFQEFPEFGTETVEIVAT